MRNALVVALSVLLAISAFANLLLWSQAASTTSELEGRAAELQSVRQQLDLAQGRAAELEATLSSQRATISRLQQQLQELQQYLPTQSPTPTPTPAAVLDPAAEAALRQIEAAVVRVRGLALRAAVPYSLMQPVELRRFLMEIFDRDYPPEQRDADQKLLRTLGLLRPDQDLVEVYLDVYSEQVLGVYDDETGRLYVVTTSGGLGPEERVTLAHELVHALQDQHYDLKRLRPKQPDNLDRNLAITALVEGDATLAMAQYARRELSPEEQAELARRSSPNTKLSSAPLIVQEELLFPYTTGLQFVLRLYQRGGWAAVDEAFRDPPESTAQIIHPEKYLARERPEAVRLPELAPVLGQGWQLVRANTLGELYLRVLLQQYLDAPSASRAAAGWRGDRYQLLQGPDGRLALAMLLLWDSVQEAQEFFAAYGQAASRRFQKAPLLSTGDRMVVSGDDYTSLARTRGQQVVVVIAPDQASAERLAGAIP